jgi:hypothetical protein
MEAAPAGREEEILMSRKMLRVLAVLSLVTLSAATVHASRRSLSSGESAVMSAWEWIAGWFHDGTGLSAVWGEEGSQMDPNGLRTDEGPGMDPNGLKTDEGRAMDPNG